MKNASMENNNFHIHVHVIIEDRKVFFVIVNLNELIM